MTTFQRIEVGAEETEHGSKRYRVDKKVDDEGVITYEYSFWLAVGTGKGKNRVFPLFAVSGTLEENSYEFQDVAMKASLWNALLDIAGVRKKN